MRLRVSQKDSEWQHMSRTIGSAGAAEQRRFRSEPGGRRNY